MNIVTICDTNPDWLDFHLLRFIRLARRAMPDATYHALIVAPYGPEPNAKTHDSLKLFDVVRFVQPEQQIGYLHYNALRYGLLERFGLSECLYVDPDVDMFAPPIIPDQGKADIRWCRSPVCPAGMDGLITKLGLSGQLVDGEGREIWPNSGMLYLRRDHLDKYMTAAGHVHRAGYDPRMIGNASFMVMCRMFRDMTAEMPYQNDVIWWERDNPVTQVIHGNMRASAYTIARGVHYCNDHGKAVRRAIDAGWVYND